MIMDAKRMVPSPDKYAVCAYEDVPIKTFYEGVFDEVFIFFHPFIRPLTTDLEQLNMDGNPNKFQMLEHCEMVTWKEMLSLTGMHNYRELDVGLRTSIYGLVPKHANKSYAKAIETACKQNNLYCPGEGMLPELLINKLLFAIQKETYDWIWVGDEFCTERKLEYIEDLINQDTLIGQNLFTHDQSLLLTTHWDSHFSMLCSNDTHMLNRIIKMCHLEGFFCDEYTKIYWSLLNA